MVILINGVPSGGGASLPTAPLGQVLISQGDGVPPVFHNHPQVLGIQVGTSGLSCSDGTVGAVAIRFFERGMPPTGEYVGNLQNFYDSSTNTPGSVIAGGGAFNVLARWNGTNWKVVAGQ